MRIARVVEYFLPHIGGMERHVFALTQEQRKLGHFVDLFIGFGDETILPNTYKILFQFLPMYSKIRRFWFNIWVYFRILKRYRKNPYDVIHLHGDFIEAYFGGKLSKKIKIPVILTIHAGLNKRLLKPKNAKYFKNIDKIICVSGEIYKDLKNIGVPENKLAIISSGIYLKDFQNIDENKIMNLKNQYTKPIIISVGVLRINKGFKYLIDAFKEVKTKFNKATLIIIGDGPERNNLKKQAQNINNIYFLGRQNHDRVIEYLKVADVFILASINVYNDREGTPTSIMEAMAAGLPVVAIEVGGVPQLIENGENGFLVKPENSENIAEALIKLINNPDLVKKMAEKNLKDIKLKDWPIIAQQIMEVYKTVL